MNTSANAGSQLTATEVKFHTYPFNCTNLLVNVLSRRSIPASLHLLTISAFYITGCGMHCRQVLLTRDRKPAPES
ncbi:hypothetical protein ZQ34_004747 [Salmonella enterica subsp. salamae]|uniref:Uncharacterized protein n=1 Tax=Salmonella enteritidis TaxID=149539 RepID=A0A5V0BCC4_SALEN|nr:hypothetical protein BAR51_23025 [Salmonella enterica subsp. enterica serovar Infantis]EBS5460207.1 hypothetical protein [Salmonella enterica subsp. enterica serovar Enteritidis]ECA5251816.1 hypothetical protein [Salmonella enterica subsp. enterica serovar Lomalinda]ECI5768514.1 hypothetical protein [Salmonella enterica subsp. enterica]EDU0502544.1 hypothetical protein [Salmonella enterica subsp. salamae]ETE47453.1 hypothetical protein L287_23880 [Salmonella enterica subsp. enterica serovar